MKKKYPDNIDEIEEFYKKELSDISFIETEDTFNRIQKAMPYEKRISSLKNYLKISVFLNILFLIFSSFFAYNYFMAEKSAEVFQSSKSEEIIKDKSSKIKADSILPTVQITKKPKTSNNNNDSKRNQIDSIPQKEPLLNTNTSTQADTIASQPIQESTITKETEPVKNSVKNPNLDFYKKYSKAKKDSTRKLFVPDK